MVGKAAEGGGAAARERGQSQQGLGPRALVTGMLTLWVLSVAFFFF